MTYYVPVMTCCERHLAEVKGKTLSLAQFFFTGQLVIQLGEENGAKCGDRGHAVLIFVASSSPMSSPSPLNPKMGHILRTNVEEQILGQQDVNYTTIVKL